MRKVVLLIVVATTMGLLFGIAPDVKPADSNISTDAKEQTILHLMFDPVREAIEGYYDEPRQYWREELISVQKVPRSASYEVVIRVETFYGPHNPPYGIETMTFHVGYGEASLINYKHEDEPG